MPAFKKEKPQLVLPAPSWTNNLKLKSGLMVAMVVGLGFITQLIFSQINDPDMYADNSRAEVLAASTTSMKINAATDFSSPWGVYPNCIAPAMPQEVHSWWFEKGETHPRHLHLATCMPNAISKTNYSKVSSKTDFVARIVVFNNPGVYAFTRWGDADANGGPNSGRNNFNSGTQCQQKPDEMKECIFYVPFTIDPAAFPHSGIREIRLTPDMNQKDLKTRQFATLNYEVYIDNGNSRSDYRAAPDPIGASWYTDVNYTTVKTNYETLLKSSNESIPTVKGIVPIKICHQTNGAPSGAKITSYLFENPDFHKYPGFHENPVDTLDPASGKIMKMLYKKDGLACGIFNWVTNDPKRPVVNGKNVLYFQTEDSEDRGISAAALKLFFNVAN